MKSNSEHHPEPVVVYELYHGSIVRHYRVDADGSRENIGPLDYDLEHSIEEWEREAESDLEDWLDSGQ